jgi:predicted DNA-binding protein (MmcQ/YjbR family)
MNIETLREYCISKRNVTEGFPFGDDTLVFKVNGKIFALIMDGAVPDREVLSWVDHSYNQVLKKG